MQPTVADLTSAAMIGPLESSAWIILRQKHPLEESDTELSDLEKIFADIIFSLNGVKYHIEFQTKADKTIIIRIMGYGIEHALSELVKQRHPKHGRV